MRKNFKIAAVFGLTLLATDPAREQALQRAIDLMEAKGDLAKAIPLFEDAARSSDKAVAARALLYLGQGQERQGIERARGTYERIVREFAGQEASVAAARKRLTALGTAQPPAMLTKRLVCRDCGLTESDISADGRWTILTDWQSGDLAVRDLGTGQQRRLFAKTGSFPASNAFAESPVLSPDQRRAVYLWETDDGKGELHVIGVEPGSKPRAILADSEHTYFEPVGWSRDGRSVLVLIERPDETWEISWVNVESGAVRVLKSLGWRLRSRTGRAAALSPDGTQIAYSALAVNPRDARGAIEAADRRVYLLAADGSKEVEVVRSAGVHEDPAFTPDGKSILFVSDMSGTFGIWSVPIRMGNPPENPSLALPETGKIGGLIVRGGAYYYWSSDRRTPVVSIAEAGTRRAPVSLVPGLHPTWSPDGKFLSFYRQRAHAADRFDLVIHSIENGEETLYWREGMRAAPPRWTHDGKGVIVLVHNAGNTRGLYRIDLASRTFKQIFEFDDTKIRGGVFALSADEQTLYQAGREMKSDLGAVVNRILSINLRTGEQTQLAALPGTGDSGLRLSPDGKTLAILRRDIKTGKAHLGCLSVEGGTVREIHTSVASQFRIDRLAWAADSRFVLIAERDASKWRVVRIPAEGGTPEDAGFDLTGVGALDNLALSPDGKRLGFSADQRRAELWTIDNVQAVLQ